MQARPRVSRPETRVLSRAGKGREDGAVSPVYENGVANVPEPMDIP